MPKLNRLFHGLSLLLLLMPPLASADALDDVLESRTIRIGVAEYVPWTIRTKSGELIGFEIDVAKKIASDIGVQADITVYEYQQLIPALQQGKIDVIAGGMTITPRRALQVNFSQPLANSGISIATNSDKTKNVNELQDFNDERFVIAVVADSLAHSVAQTFFELANIQVYPSSELAEQEILEDRAHAYIGSVPEVNFLALVHSDKVDVPLRDPIMASSEGLAVKKGEQEFLNFLNSWVVARQTDKWLGTTRDYWFKTLDWMPYTKK